MYNSANQMLNVNMTMLLGDQYMRLEPAESFPMDDGRRLANATRASFIFQFIEMCSTLAQ
eukprot:m.82937 g.82937  ORF g.82937 m.82937 type:complete len:60 (-) comp12705_c0_seq4:579-758(-)